VASANEQVTQSPLPGGNIPKYVDAVPQPARITATSVSLNPTEAFQKVLPSQFYSSTWPGTLVWAYSNAGRAVWPGPTLEQRQGTATQVTYTNQLQGPFTYVDPFGASHASQGAPILQKLLTLDQTIHWADVNGLACMFRPVTCSPDSVDPCCKPYGYPDWPGAAVPLNRVQREGEPVPHTTHLHGAEVPSAFDGHPESWFTPNGKHGIAYQTASATANNAAIYRYPNTQESTMLWYHDHVLGATRINILAGLAGMYLLRDARDTGRADNSIRLPAGSFERELMIQDRQFDTNGQLFFPDNGNNPEVHPFWIPEFFGDVMCVNGKSWPYMNVERRRYRFRIVNGSNARFLHMRLSDGRPFYQIGSDGGLLDAPVRMNDLLLGVAERADVIIDFSNAPVGSRIIVTNDANAPFPGGDPVDPDTTAQVMQFRVVTATSADATCNPAQSASQANGCRLRATPIQRLAGLDEKRQLVLREVESDIGEPLEVLLNNTKWSGLLESTLMNPTPSPLPDSRKVNDYYVTEIPQQGATEVWEVGNMTEDAHPIHIHLVQFQVVSRRPFDVDTYLALFEARTQPGDGPPMPYKMRNGDGAIGGNFAFSPYYTGPATPPEANETGWKDTIIMYPGTVTRLRLRWAPQALPPAATTAGVNYYTFDPKTGPGYVWHCHILDHEDNEMMRPYTVGRDRQVPLAGPLSD
jgi:FtsP/CotA-like multicopper oxidase with cupredoxin domain